MDRWRRRVEHRRQRQRAEQTLARAARRSSETLPTRWWPRRAPDRRLGGPIASSEPRPATRPHRRATTSHTTPCAARACRTTAQQGPRRRPRHGRDRRSPRVFSQVDVPRGGLALADRGMRQTLHDHGIAARPQPCRPHGDDQQWCRQHQHVRSSRAARRRPPAAPRAGGRRARARWSAAKPGVRSQRTDLPRAPMGSAPTRGRRR